MYNTVQFFVFVFAVSSDLRETLLFFFSLSGLFASKEKEKKRHSINSKHTASPHYFLFLSLHHLMYRIGASLRSFFFLCVCICESSLSVPGRGGGGGGNRLFVWILAGLFFLSSAFIVGYTLLFSVFPTASLFACCCPLHCCNSCSTTTSTLFALFSFFISLYFLFYKNS